MSTKKMIIIISIVLICLVGLGLMFYFIIKSENDDEKTPFNTVPSKEDLNFTERGSSFIFKRSSHSDNGFSHK